MNRLPRRVSLGLTRTVLVKLIPPATLSGIIGRNKAGCWDGENSTIWIDATLSLARKWRAFRHELMHAVVDVHEDENGSI